MSVMRILRTPESSVRQIGLGSCIVGAIGKSKSYVDKSDLFAFSISQSSISVNYFPKNEFLQSIPHSQLL